MPHWPASTPSMVRLLQTPTQKQEISISQNTSRNILLPETIWKFLHQSNYNYNYKYQCYFKQCCVEVVLRCSQINWTRRIPLCISIRWFELTHYKWQFNRRFQIGDVGGLNLFALRTIAGDFPAAGESRNRWMETCWKFWEKFRPRSSIYVPSTKAETSWE
jgi:hypothetical protein